MVDLVLLKHLHVTLAVTSVSLFVLRFIAREMGAGFMSWRLLKVLPHLIDTLLLASGIGLAAIYRLSPLDAHWLLVKLVFIVGYIAFGVGAMKSSRAGARMICALLALCLIISAMLLAVLKPF
jgi:uncharacterized membrane protein SirB2